jgi:hypothetical protein
VRPAYRPDPSYLPAIEDHIRDLKADQATAEAIGTDSFAVRNLADQVTAFRDVSERMRERLAAFPPGIRDEIEEASRVLRKVRVTEGRTQLSLAGPAATGEAATA